MIEPYAIRQSFGAPFLPPKAKPPATPYASYPEALLARLLAQEARDVRKRHSGEPGRTLIEQQGGVAKAPLMIDGGEEYRIARLQAAMAVKSDATRDKVLAATRIPSTVCDIARVTAMSRFSVANYLAQLHLDGLVHRTRLKGVAIWSQGDPEPPEETQARKIEAMRQANLAISAETRARVFADMPDGMSISAIARTIGLGRKMVGQHLHQLAAEGRVTRDGIRWTRTQEAAE
jgi:predicted Rossmann fold nucleotide-binding protein DprA/Smf involved in DNA uptake